MIEALDRIEEKAGIMSPDLTESTLSTEETTLQERPREDIPATVESIPDHEYGAVPAAAVLPEIKTDKRPSVLVRLLKWACCCAMAFVAFVCIAGALVEGKNNHEWLCFPDAFLITGALTANTARRKGLKGSGLKWWIYGTLVPVVSWIEVTMAGSQSKFRGFLKGLVISLLGILAFLFIFLPLLPPVEKTSKPATGAIMTNPATVAVSGNVSADKVTKAENPVHSADLASVPVVKTDSVKETLAPAVPDAKAMAAAERERKHQEEAAKREERERQAEIKREQQAYLKEANTVVVTPKSKKYHYASCRTVRGKYRTLTIAQARKKGYKPCGVCEPQSQPVTLENSGLDEEMTVYYGGR